MKTTKLLGGLLCSLIAVASFDGGARAGSGGSIYSLIGIGDVRYSPGARSLGMGYAGIGLAAPQYINGMSPASWYRINRTRLEGTALYEGFNSTDGTVSRYLARLDFGGALLAIPVAPSEGIVLVGGFTPYSNISYDTYTRGTFTTTADTLKYLLHHTGTGGITRAQLGLSWAPHPSLALGASMNYLFGTLTSSIEQLPTTPGSLGGTVRSNQSAGGLNFTAGLLYSGLGDLTEALRPLSLGVTVTTRANLHTTNQVNYEYTLERDTSSESFGRLAIPFSLGIGLAYQPGERWAVAADYMMQPWSEADFQGSSPAGLRDSYRFGIGAERTGNRDNAAPWLDRISYRLGFTYHQTYYTLNGQGINEWGVTAGMAFPLSGESRLNVAAEYGGRGTLTSNLIEDRIFRMTVSLNISDLWFIRYEEE